MSELIRDWWRGFSQIDLTSAINKIDAAKALNEPGSITWLSEREMKAWTAWRAHCH